MKSVPKRNLEVFEDGLRAGDIILLWRIAFGTFTTESPFPKYFAQTYGIDAPVHLRELIKNEYVMIDDVYDALENHISCEKMRTALKEKGVKGASSMLKLELIDLMEITFSEEELEAMFKIRGYSLTEKGETALKNHADVVEKHPKKKI